MKIKIIAVGRLKNSPLRDLCDEYIKRLGWPVRIEEIDSPKAATAAIEAPLILKHIPENAFVVALDERGESFSSPAFAEKLSRWRDMALAEIDAALSENRLPVVVGGTGFYIRAVTEGLSRRPAVPEDIRRRLGAEIAAEGNATFHKRLAARDPVMAARLHPGNTQRLIRAMEMLEHTGKSLAEWQAQPPVPPPAHLRFVKIALLPPRGVLYNRCDSRFLQMMETGVLEEVEKFPPPGPEKIWPLHKALGYPELRACLSGTLTRAAAIEAAQQSTRHYAKRQVTWFRHQMRPDIVLEDADAGAALAALGL